MYDITQGTYLYRGFSSDLEKTLGSEAHSLVNVSGKSVVSRSSSKTMPTRGSLRSEYFPENFLWGCATSAYQIEGAVTDDGRGPSIWDVFSHTTGKTRSGHNADVAADYYHRYREDILLMKGLGVKAFRFSIAWSRIFPNGTGVPNVRGMDFYQRVVDTLLSAGIEPFCTLYHWDLQQALQEHGGWENRDTTNMFADYAAYVVHKLSDKVKYFLTMNEMRLLVEQGYRLGLHAPGLRLSGRRLAQVSHFLALAHGLAARAIRAQSRSGTHVGLADLPTAATPVFESAEQIAAARTAMREENASCLTLVLEGRYTDLYLERLGANAPHFTQADLDIIRTPLDFVGLNVYCPTYVCADESDGGYSIVSMGTSFPRMLSHWLHIGPEALYWTTKLVSELWNTNVLYVTENGASCLDEPSADGYIYDVDRIMFLRCYLTQLQRAVADGVPIGGYFVWSLLDNFEWADGYERRFGIVYVNFATQKRIPKLSAEFYREVIKQNRIV